MEVLYDIPTMDMTNSPTGCCPVFDPTGWDNKLFCFERLRFVQATTRSFLYMPLNMGSVMAKSMKLIKESNADLKDRYLVLSRDISKWRAYHYFLVSKDVFDMPSADLTGHYYSKVYEGSYQNMSKWYKDLTATIAQQGMKADGFLSFYTTCPKCAKTYGKNYVVLFARVKEHDKP
ncbi:MAG: hydrolase [Saccharofermentanales bacterium]